MWFWIGIYLSVSLVSCTGLIVIAMLSGYLKEMVSEREIEHIYLSAITWQNMLERGEREKDAVVVSGAWEYLEALEQSALDEFGVFPDGSWRADVVRDMVYCNITPQETRERLQKWNENKYNDYVSAYE